MSFYRCTIYGREVTPVEAQAWLKAEGISQQFDWNIWKRESKPVAQLESPRRDCPNCGAPYRPVCDYCGS